MILQVHDTFFYV